MSLRQLVEGDCGGVNPLMQLGGQFTRDNAHKEEGFSGSSHAPFESRSVMPEDQLVNEFLGQISGPPQTFQMDALLQEMREIEAQRFQPQVVNAPRVIDEVTRNSSQWAKEFGVEGATSQQQAPAQYNELWQQHNMINVQPAQANVAYVREFFDMNDDSQEMQTLPRPPPQPYLAICPPYVPPAVAYGDSEMGAVGGQTSASTEDWLNDYQTSKEDHEKATADYNAKFWNRLQEEWQKLSEDGSSDHPWLSDYSELYDPYKEYTYVESNPFDDLEGENLFEKGKTLLNNGDIPSSVLCFEAAAKKDPENAEIWEFLGIAQAENEMDPQSISALKRSLALKPNNMPVLMALAVSYTNESLQSHALKCLTTWLHCHPRYKHLVPDNLLRPEEPSLTSSLVRGPELKEIQNLFLEAVKENPNEIDADVQEALGVLFNLSSEFDKAVDCFKAALHVRPTSAKIWNRLGASLANGNRSVEAVEAYQQALRIEPGFIRVRYNVGVCCMNLKAYREAGEHLLIALHLQKLSVERTDMPVRPSTGHSNEMSDTIWSTLKMVISLMGRSDLMEKINNKDLKELNRDFKLT